MSDCNYISLIYEQECIGDSLVKINNNFNNINSAVCDLEANQSTLSASVTAFITTYLGSSSANWNNTYNAVSQLSSSWTQTVSTVSTILTSYVPLVGNSTIVGDLNVQNRLLSGTVDLFDIFSTTDADAQTLSYESSSYNLSISNGNTVNLSSVNSTVLPTVTNYLSTSNVLVSSISFSASATPPALSSEPVAWTDVYINNVQYKLPLYQ
jgi:hypothetical protein